MIKNPTSHIVTAHLGIVDPATGLFLVGKRANSSRPELNGLGEFLGGKKGRKDRKLSRTALREVREEAGVSPKIYPTGFRKYKETPLVDAPQLRAVGYIALARLFAKDVHTYQFDSGEVSEIGWMPLGKIRSLAEKGQFCPDTTLAVTALFTLIPPVLRGRVANATMPPESVSFIGAL